MNELLAYLGSRPENGLFQTWRIVRIEGGANNLIYRVTNSQADLAFKFTIDDARHHANREYHALLALQQAGLDIAPVPVFLDETTYALPVVVQTWLDGEASAIHPQNDEEWDRLLKQ